MNLLLDTHVLLWVLTNDPKLSERVRKALTDSQSVVYVSAVTAWEIAIKRGLGKLKAPDGYMEALARNRFTPLNVTSEHALTVEHLPQHHNDPFDRLLIAQARVEALTLVTHDERIYAYEVKVLKV